MREQLLVACLSASVLAACRAAVPEQRHSLLFSARYGNELDAKWRVHINSATIEPQGDGTTKDKGVVKSSWYVNGEPIRPRGSQSDLPLPFLDNGIAQECWAFWDGSSHQWSWQ